MLISDVVRNMKKKKKQQGKGALASFRPRLYRAHCFSRRGLVLFLIFYKSSIFCIKTRVKQSSSCFSRELFKIKSGYTAVFHDNLAITQRKKPAWKTASGEKSDFLNVNFTIMNFI